LHYKSNHSSLPFNSSPCFRKMQKCFEGIMTHDIPYCLVIINANTNSMAILEVDQLQIPIFLSWCSFLCCSSEMFKFPSKLQSHKQVANLKFEFPNKINMKKCKEFRNLELKKLKKIGNIKKIFKNQIYISLHWLLSRI
jgi:hypothetical protein